MFLEVKFSEELFRWLFQPIYACIESTASEQGQANSNIIATGTLTALLNNDPTLGLFIDLEDNEVKGHCLYHLPGNNYAHIIQINGVKEFQDRCYSYLSGLETINFIATKAVKVIQVENKEEEEIEN